MEIKKLDFLASLQRANVEQIEIDTREQKVSVINGFKSEEFVLLHLGLAISAKCERPLVVKILL